MSRQTNMMLGGVAGGVAIAVMNILLFDRSLLGGLVTGIIFAVVYAAMAVLFPPRL